MSEYYKVEVRFESREDGGIRVWSPDVRGFRLSHTDLAAVLKDVIPALEGVLSAQLNAVVKVVRLRPLSRSDKNDDCRIPKKEEYAAAIATA